MGGLHCFGIDSCWRLTGKRWGLVWLRFGQLGPDQVPVVGAQVFAGDLAAGFALDGHTDNGFQKLPDGNRLAQISDRGAAALRERSLFRHRQAVQVFQEGSHG